MKLFENIAEYHAFKRKYELMGELEEERLLEAANDPKSFYSFLEFLDEIRLLQFNNEAAATALEEELATDIERQEILNKVRSPLI